mmetsp:Transcript_4956/g.4736  ORF Transcript_4956/g.4736 Transcript_4956/m.4736 type:complete len:542 (+) Transcript_4956:57-1682(+)
MINDEINMTANLNTEKTYFQIHISMPTDHYVGIGFGEDMFNVPMVVADGITPPSDETPIIHDCFSIGHKLPVDNTENVYNLIEHELEENQWSLTFERPIKLERDGRDETMDITKPMIMVYGFRDEAYKFHGKGNRGLFNMTIDPSTGKAYFNGGIPDGNIYFKVHGILMYIGWSIMTFISIVSGRYMKHYYNFRMIIHASVGLLIAVNTVVVIIFALTKYGSPDSSARVAHKPIGIAIMVVSVVQCLEGMTVKQVAGSNSVQSIWGKRSKIVHQVVGYLLIILSNLQVATGLVNYESPVTNLIYLHFAVFVLMLGILEGIYRYKFQYKKKGVIKKMGVPEYSEFEFNEMLNDGQKLVLFNNFIIDVDSFQDQHPGTAYVISENIGKDIGKYFYGAYSMSPDISPYTHSNYAANLLEKLIIGKIKPILTKTQRGNGINLSGTKEAESLLSSKNITTHQSEILNPLQTQDYTFIIKEKEKIAPGLARVMLQSLDANVKKFYPGLKLSGKSWSITSLQNFVSRYYTICNCMGSQIYDEYIKAIT